MSFYENQVLPRVINLILGTEEILALRQRVAERVSGVVLEIGFGSGLNLPYLSSALQKLYALDPALLGRKLAAERLHACSFPVEFIDLEANHYPLADASVDCVLCTWTLCTIPDVEVALQEVKRVLKPGGRLVFIEHGLADSAGTIKWQQRLNGLQKKLAGGCNLNRNIRQLIEQAGLKMEFVENYFMPGPKPYTYLYEGVATKTC